MHIQDLETPALIIDLDNLENNMRTMMRKLEGRATRLRPHFKSAKISEIARMQMAAGAKGITCAKLSEAEVLVDAGISDVLIANQIVNPRKLAGLARLALRAGLAVAADDEGNLCDLSAAACRAGSTIGVFVELDIGMGRCGVRDEHALLRLAKKAQALPGLRFKGIQAYEGHLVHVDDAAERRAGYERALAILRTCVSWLEENGVPVPEISGGGTGTHEMALEAGALTELQAGSYIYMDARYRQVEGTGCFAPSLHVLTEIVGHSEEFAIGDAGLKCMSAEFGPPVLEGGESEAVKLSEEHVKICDAAGRYARGDRLLLLPSHCCTTINLFDKAYGVRNGVVEREFVVDGRGKSR